MWLIHIIFATVIFINPGSAHVNVFPDSTFREGQARGTPFLQVANYDAFGDRLSQPLYTTYKKKSSAKE